MQASSTILTPALSPLSLADLCTQYLRVRFRSELDRRSSQSIGISMAPLPLPPIMLPVHLTIELDCIAKILADAFLDRVKIDWDATRYAQQLPKRTTNTASKAAIATEAALKRQYPPKSDSAAAGIIISGPWIVIDMDGVILAWHLPGILNDSRQRAMMSATETLRPLLEKSLEIRRSDTPWRINPKNFRPGTVLPSGVTVLSPAWYQQGHEETVQVAPQASANFRSPAAMDWLDQISESNAILSAILGVIHPTLYNAGRDTFNRLRQSAEIERQDVLRQWTSVFSGVSVICNGITDPHRDGQSRNQWYDLLATLGPYQNCNLELPGLGLSLEYGPGAVVGLSGMMLEHEVPSFEGERACYVYFMRDKVHERAKVPGGVWMKTNYYETST